MHFPTATKNRVLGALPHLHPGFPLTSWLTWGHRRTPGWLPREQRLAPGGPSVPPEEYDPQPKGGPREPASVSALAVFAGCAQPGNDFSSVLWRPARCYSRPPRGKHTLDAWSTCPAWALNTAPQSIRGTSSHTTSLHREARWKTVQVKHPRESRKGINGLQKSRVSRLSCESNGSEQKAGKEREK